MGFQVPPSKASKGQDKFEFGPGSGSEFSVKKAKFCKIAQLEKIEQGGAAAIDFFGAAGTKQGDFVRDLDRDQFQTLIEAWQDDSNVTAGESQAS